MSEQNFTESNRVAWNQAVPYHAQQTLERLLERFREPGAVSLDSTLTALLVDKIQIQGKDASQLSCNNGRETLSMKNLGARRCTGFDISDGFIEQAHQLNAAAGLDCEFVRTDVYAIPDSYNSSFDVVLLTVGTIGWMPDLPGFLRVIYRLLRPGGQLLIYEMHPILDMFDSEPGLKQTPAPRHSYFKQEPFIEQGGLDYYGNQEYQAAVTYWFHHKLSDIVNGLLKYGFRLEWFEEYPHDLSNVFAGFEQMEAPPPLSYSLIARRAE